MPVSPLRPGIVIRLRAEKVSHLEVVDHHLDLEGRVDFHGAQVRQEHEFGREYVCSAGDHGNAHRRWVSRAGLYSSAIRDSFVEFGDHARIKTLKEMS
jgi:hypothetical protein